ncbi:MAG: hypothetical protein KDC74_08010 [Flavobacteriaceae bacterium]|nr:hypothetical protein [Flavobacteriaceae bacterium]
MMLHIKDSLFEDLTAHYISALNLPPLSSKIFTYMVFDFEREGVTFEEIQENLCASKSSISNSLGQLVQIGLAEYITKIDSRKRYYRLNPEFVITRFEQQITQFQREHSLLERLIEYKKQVVEKEGADELGNVEIIKDYIKKTIENLEITLEKFKKNYKI